MKLSTFLLVTVAGALAGMSQGSFNIVNKTGVEWSYWYLEGPNNTVYGTTSVGAGGSITPDLFQVIYNEGGGAGQTIHLHYDYGQDSDYRDYYYEIGQSITPEEHIFGSVLASQHNAGGGPVAWDTFTVPLPEPSTNALFLTATGLLLWRAGRGRRSSTSAPSLS